MKWIDETFIEHVAVGAAVLGTGGGGDPYIGKLLAKEAIRKYGPVMLVGIDELKDDELVVPVSGMGAPSVMLEKMVSETEITGALDALEKAIGRTADVLMPIEVGGVNSLLPIAAAAIRRLPVLDADAMGRAFPEAQMVTFYLDGYESSPVSIADEKGNAAVLYPKDGVWSETLARALTVVMGGSATVCDYWLEGKDVKKSAIPNTLSMAERIGATLLKYKGRLDQGLYPLLKELGGQTLFTGKITDVKRVLEGGFTKGELEIAGLKEDAGRSCTIRFQNEFLLCTEGEHVICSTPDLILMLDLETGLPITTETLKYGMRVIAAALPCHDKWRTPKGIETAGPKYFGYEVEYVPLELSTRQEQKGGASCTE